MDKRRERHGLHETPEYRAWQNLRQRCGNPSDPKYLAYGGRGIAVCAEWDRSFMAFYEAMGPRPSANHSIDRIDNDGDYEPDNCRWATRSEQNRNIRVLRLEHDGMKLSVAEWAVLRRIKPNTIYRRLHRGASIAEALA